MQVVVQRKVQRVQLVVFLGLLLNMCTSGWSDSTIVFSATFYKWGHKRAYEYGDNGYRLRYEREPMPMQAHSHLYLVHPNGTPLTRITSGSFDDRSPSWSPDHTQIAFLRQYPSGTTDLCSMSVANRRILRLYRIGNDFPRECAWSPRGNAIALVSEPDASYGSVTTDRLTVVDRSRDVLSLKGVKEFAWSPDGSQLFLRHSNDRCEVWNIANHQTRPTPSLINATWLNDNRVLGIRQEPGENNHFDVLDVKSGQLRSYEFNVSGTQEEEIDPLDPFYFADISWHRSPAGKVAFVFEADYGMSDGEHSCCYTVTIGSSTINAQPVGRYALGGYSPGGSDFVVFGHEWVGTYKRGGAQLGSLQIQTASGKIVRSLTGSLVDIEGASWFDAGGLMNIEQ
jgi:hypothetical protein